MVKRSPKILASQDKATSTTGSHWDLCLDTFGLGHRGPAL